LFPLKKVGFQRYEVWKETEATDSGVVAGVEGQVLVVQGTEEARASHIGGSNVVEWVLGIWQNRS